MSECLLEVDARGAVAEADMAARLEAILDERTMALLARESWMQRSSAEGQEGLAAFAEKRRPAWYRGPAA
jgi:enoyl-CoA hydratase/carnithine racemase